MPTTIEPGDWDALNDLLAKYARTINNQRRRIEALEAGATGSTSPEQQPVGSEPTVQGTGRYVPDPHCVVCKASKETGRTALTCKTCGSERAAAIRDKTPYVKFTACCNCGAKIGGGGAMLCQPCSRSFKVWKTTV